MWLLTAVLVFVVFIPACFVSGFVGAQKGRSGIGWFMLAFVVTPLLALLALAALPNADPKDGRPV